MGSWKVAISLEVGKYVGNKTRKRRAIVVYQAMTVGHVIFGLANGHDYYRYTDGLIIYLNDARASLVGG